MNCAVIIVNWNGADILRQCLHGLLRQECHRVYVVDNGSTDGSQEVVRSEFPAVTLICSPANLGFAAGNNLGIERAVRDGAEAVCLLNNDTIIDEPFIGPCLEALRSDSSIGVVGPVVVEGNASDIIQAAGGSWNLWTVDMPFRKRGLPFHRMAECETVDWVLGAAMIIRTDMLPKIGGPLDPEFFPAYVEEAELCYRAWLGGFRSVVVHAVRVRHLGGQSGGAKAVVFRRMMINRYRFALKHLSPTKFAVAATAITLRCLVEKVVPKWS